MGGGEGDGDEEVEALLGFREDGAVGDVIGVALFWGGSANREDGSLVDDAAVFEGDPLAVVGVDGEGGDGDGVGFVGVLEDVVLGDDVEAFQAAGFANVEGGREVAGVGEFVGAETESGVGFPDGLGDCGIGGEEVIEFEGVLLVGFPDGFAA